MLDFAAPFELTLDASTPLRLDDWVERHKLMVFRTAWRMLGSAADAEDIAQEVFLRVHSQSGEVTAAWIYRVTVNLCLDHIRKRKPQADSTELSQLAAPQSNPEQVLDNQAKQAQLARLIARLPERERACLVLRDLEGMNSREVAAILDCTEETVRTSIHRAKGKLRQWMS
jgi:RNA polymerase sigma-70 factor, ECF subfamily